MIKRIDLDLNLCLRPAFPHNYLASMANGHIGHSSKAKYGRKSIPHNLAMHSLTLTGLRQVVIKPKERDNYQNDHSGDGDQSGSARNCDCKLATTAAESVVAEKRQSRITAWSRDRWNRVAELVVMMERSTRAASNGSHKPFQNPSLRYPGKASLLLNNAPNELNTYM